MALGDVLLMYTDGMTDALNEQGENFGLERLGQVLSAHRHLDAHGIAAALQQAVLDFAGDEPAFDDQTLVVLKRDSVLPLPVGEGRGEGSGLATHSDHEEV
jgi:sigma-B regulation protein RsbU (phosphoserine phosphatase)